MVSQYVTLKEIASFNPGRKIPKPTSGEKISFVRILESKFGKIPIWQPFTSLELATCSKFTWVNEKTMRKGRKEEALFLVSFFSHHIQVALIFQFLKFNKFKGLIIFPNTPNKSFFSENKITHDQNTYLISKIRRWWFSTMFLDKNKFPNIRACCYKFSF